VFTFQGLPATGPHHCLQSEVWTNHTSRQYGTLPGSRLQEHRSYESVRRHVQSLPWKQLSTDHCCCHVHSLIQCVRMMSCNLQMTDQEVTDPVLLSCLGLFGRIQQSLCCSFLSRKLAVSVSFKLCEVGHILTLFTPDVYSP